MKTTTRFEGMSIDNLDSTIARTSGVSARTGHMRFLVADGHRYDYGSRVVSIHRRYRRAVKACRDGLVVWMWDSYMGTSGGYRAV